MIETLRRKEERSVHKESPRGPRPTGSSGAEDLDLKGVRVDDPDDVASAWEEVLGADRPAVLEAITDPDVPLLPPHITLEQAKAMMSAIAKRDPDTTGIVKQSIKGVADDLLLHREQ